MKAPLTPEQLEGLRRWDTCAIANAIETFAVRLRNEGFADSSIRSLFARPTPMVGYAVTAKIRCTGPSPDGHDYHDRTDWWNLVASVPAPRVVVIQDVDVRPGSGSFLGEVHSNILMALHCVGAVTNGAVRDLPAVEATGFHFFAHNVAMSHGYVHMVELGGTIEVGGLKVQPGDLLHGDCHGVLSIPHEIAAEVAGVAARITERERRIIALCRSPEFSLEKLTQAVREVR